MNPDELRTVQAIHSWLASSAAMITSPSFSRLSLSATMIGPAGAKLGEGLGDGGETHASLLDDSVSVTSAGAA